MNLLEFLKIKKNEHFKQIEELDRIIKILKEEQERSLEVSAQKMNSWNDEAE